LVRRERRAPVRIVASLRPVAANVILRVNSDLNRACAGTGCQRRGCRAELYGQYRGRFHSGCGQIEQHGRPSHSRVSGKIDTHELSYRRAILRVPVLERVARKVESRGTDVTHVEVYVELPLLSRIGLILRLHLHHARDAFATLTHLSRSTRLAAGAAILGVVLRIDASLPAGQKPVTAGALASNASLRGGTRRRAIAAVRGVRLFVHATRTAFGHARIALALASRTRLACSASRPTITAIFGIGLRVETLAATRGEPDVANTGTRRTVEGSATNRVAAPTVVRIARRIVTNATTSDCRW